MKLKFMVAFVAFVLSASAAVITNGTFDSNCSGWTGTNNDNLGGCFTTGGNPGGMFEMNGGGAVGTDPTVEQNVTGLVIGQSYTLSGNYRNYYAYPTATNAFGVLIDNVQRQFNVNGFPPPPGQLANIGTAPWQTFSFTFTYSGASSLLRFTGERNGSDTDVAIDNIAIADFIEMPEPTTFVLVGAGLVAATLGRRRR